MCNILKFTQISLIVLIPYLLTYSQQCFVTTLLHHNVYCFNGFNQTAIVLRYSAHMKPRKMIKTIKTENIKIWFRFFRTPCSRLFKLFVIREAAASEVTTLWRFMNLIIIIILLFYYYNYY